MSISDYKTGLSSVDVVNAHRSVGNLSIASLPSHSVGHEKGRTLVCGIESEDVDRVAISINRVHAFDLLLGIRGLTLSTSAVGRSSNQSVH